MASKPRFVLWNRGSAAALQRDGRACTGKHHHCYDGDGDGTGTGLRQPAVARARVGGGGVAGRLVARLCIRLGLHRVREGVLVTVLVVGAGIRDARGDGVAQIGGLALWRRCSSPIRRAREAARSGDGSHRSTAPRRRLTRRCVRQSRRAGSARRSPRGCCRLRRSASPVPCRAQAATSPVQDRDCTPSWCGPRGTPVTARTRRCSRHRIRCRFRRTSGNARCSVQISNPSDRWRRQRYGPILQRISKCMDADS